jgi:hypothetical protein
MAQKADLHVGDRVSALRMSNKAVTLTGKALNVREDSECVDITVDQEGGGEFVESVHAADVTVLEPAAKGAAAEPDAEKEDEPKSKSRARHG